MKVCTAHQMREADKEATKKYGIPSILLMENAARVCVDEIKNFDSFLILCGKGNNGGDGLAIARHLYNIGKKVKIYLVLGNDFSQDAKLNYDILQNMSVPFYFADDFETLKQDISASDCVVDAIFGTGLTRPVDDFVCRVIDAVNEYANFTLCVDVPSGISADTGEILSKAVKADKTVTFAAYKTGLLMYPAADFTGEIKVCDISLPKKILSDVKREVLGEEDIQNIFPKREKNSQKGDYGKVFIIGGSVGMAGAVCLAAESAFKMGAGIVTVCVPKEINDIVAKRVVTAMTYPVDFKSEQDKIIEKSKGFDAILFGNGIGREDFLAELLEKVLKNTDVPVVIDADGLFALSKKSELLKLCRGKTVLTPHSMEMARMINCDVKTVEKDRLGISEKFVLENDLTLVLKGNHTIITAQDGKQFINLTGNSGMATAGSGDVLAGMTAGLVSRCGMLNSAVLSVYLHGKAGDFGANKYTETSLTAEDIVNSIPHILPVEI